MKARKTYRNLKNFCRAFVFLFLLILNARRARPPPALLFIFQPLPPAPCSKALEPLILELMAPVLKTDPRHPGDKAYTLPLGP